MAIVAEPYCALQGWLESEDGSVAMVGSGGPHPLPFMSRGRGEGFVAAKWGETVVVGVYSSPNGTLLQLEQLLGRVGAIVIASHPSPVIVAGDFNAKSALWNSRGGCGLGQRARPRSPKSRLVAHMRAAQWRMHSRPYLWHSGRRAHGVGALEGVGKGVNPIRPPVHPYGCIGPLLRSLDSWPEQKIRPPT